MVPPELLNNYAVLLTETNKNHEAKKVLDEALANCEKMLAQDSEDIRLKALKITTKFNLACCIEVLNNIGEATEIFKDVTKEEPSYTDAYIRLAYLAKRRGDLARAIGYVDTAITNSVQKPPHSKPVNLFCLRGKLLVEKGRLDEAKREFQKAMEMSGNRDTYAFIGLANINYTLSCMHRNDINGQESQLRSALSKYFGILELDENNTYASLGIANLLTEYGKVDEAKEVFKLLANSEADNQLGLDAMLNQSHLWMAEENFDTAINLYQACLAKSPDNLEITMYLSKAHFRK
jgi:RNA polymerase-associated protein CTR9